MKKSDLEENLLIEGKRLAPVRLYGFKITSTIKPFQMMLYYYFPLACPYNTEPILGNTTTCESLCDNDLTPENNTSLYSCGCTSPEQYLLNGNLCVTLEECERRETCIRNNLFSATQSRYNFQ